VASERRAGALPEFSFEEAPDLAMKPKETQPARRRVKWCGPPAGAWNSGKKESSRAGLQALGAFP
jgi:hypothetical protein